MTPEDVAILAAVAILLALAAFFGMAETGLTRMGQARATALEAEGRRGGGALASLVRQPERFLGPLLLMALASQLVAATLVGVLAERRLGPTGIAAATVGVVIVTFVFAEAAPKTWAIQHHDRAALLTAPIIRALAATPLLRVPTAALVGLANAILPGKGLRRGPFVSEAELLAIADMAAEHEVIERREQAWIRSIIEFGETVAREAMVPRTDMVTAPATATVSEVLDLSVDAGLSRLPVLDPTIDDVAGIVYARDLMEARHEDRSDEPVRSLARPAHYVPETKRIADLLPEMQQGQFHLAIVVDEHGGTAGLVTLEDLIEELVGEIADEYDVEEPLVQPDADGTTHVSGRIRIDELNQLLGTDFPEGDWDTAAGFVCALLGHIPAEGETATYGEHTFRAERVRGRRVIRLHLAKRAPTDIGPDEGNPDDPD
jgi:putative hemolysin